MKHRWWWALGVVLMCVLPMTADARVWYVSAAGNGTECTAGEPCALGTANDGVAPGDVVYLADGSYSETIAPDQHGTAANRITYIGDMATPSNVALTGSITLSKDYITVKGVAASGGLGFEDVGRQDVVKGDSIGWSTGTGLGFCGAQNCVAYKNVITGAPGDGWVFTMLPKVGSGCDQKKSSSYNIIPQSNTVRQNAIFTYALDVANKANLIVGAQLSTIDSNRFVGTFTRVGSSGERSYLLRLVSGNFNLTFRDNYFHATGTNAHNSPNAGWCILTIRDSSEFIKFERDTFITAGSHAIEMFALQSGDQPTQNGAWENDHRFHSWTRCVMKFGAPIGGTNPGFAFEDNCQGCTIKYNKVYAEGKPVFFEKMSGSTVEYNTFYGFTSPNFFINSNVHPPQYSLIRHNIFFARDDPSAGQYIFHAKKNPCGAAGTVGCVDYNLFYSTLGSGSTTTAQNIEGVTGPVGYSGSPCQTYLANCSSVWGNPALEDVTVGNIDFRPKQGTAAVDSTGQIWPCHPDSAAVNRCYDPNTGNVLGETHYIGAFAPRDTLYPGTLAATFTNNTLGGGTCSNWELVLIASADDGNNPNRSASFITVVQKKTSLGNISNEDFETGVPIEDACIDDEDTRAIIMGNRLNPVPGQDYTFTGPAPPGGFPACTGTGFTISLATRYVKARICDEVGNCTYTAEYTCYTP